MLLWNTMSTQWRMGTSGLPLGLDYGALYRVAETYGIRITPALLEKLRHLEALVIRDAVEEAKGKK